jgi:hypothetical protein
LTVTTLGSDDEEFPDAGQDTLISLHSGCPASASNTIACNDTASFNDGSDTGQLVDAALQTIVTAGQVVIIRVARVDPGVPDSNHPARLNIAFTPMSLTVCSGDGTAAACPCANTGSAGHGCSNSQDSTGAQLIAVGVGSVSNDSLDLQGSHMPASSVALFAQSDAAISGGIGVAFGDGLRCLGGTVIRLGIQHVTNGAATFGVSSGSPVSGLGQITSPGTLRFYQAWYRDAAPYCTTATWNLSNALSVLWLP